jgi:hypothetical protein
MSVSDMLIFKSIGSFPIKCIINKNKNQYYDLQVEIEPSTRSTRHGD